MDNSNEVRDFLTTRRARITPERAGITPLTHTARRVPGLRREEVAQLAGVSVDYYVRLERGNLRGVSESVLDALARALQLDRSETAHLYDLTRTANTPGFRPPPVATGRVRPTARLLLNSLSGPAYLRNSCFDILAVNALGQALYAPILDSPSSRSNTARFAFLDPGAVDFWVDWERMAAGVVASLRAEAGRRPHDTRLTNLIGELCTRSDDFRTRWGRHDVYAHTSGAKTLNHPLVGEIELSYEAMSFATDQDLVLIAYTAEPGSPAAESLDLLASWTTSEQTRTS